MRLVSDVEQSSLQLVEMCSEGVWTPVCDYNWTVADAAVVCKESGYGKLGGVTTFLTEDIYISTTSLYHRVLQSVRIKWSVSPCKDSTQLCGQ